MEVINRCSGEKKILTGKDLAIGTVFTFLTDGPEVVYLKISDTQVFEPKRNITRTFFQDALVGFVYPKAQFVLNDPQVG